ncbi:MAG TPA: Tad domain-containing protein [Planctomycetota bacterium]|nr:Tad domain-containing protein [Planctomycetota bacterium]
MKITVEGLVRAARRAHEDEEGSSMVFGAITLFTLALFTLMVYVVGINSSARLQNQSAADSAAYSGALVQAEAMESIAFLNDGMAYVYYAELRYTIDMIVYSTLQLFHQHDDWVNQYYPNRTEPDAGPSPGTAMEISVGPQLNNPGGRAGQNYSPGLEHGGNEPPDYSFVEMGQTQGGNGTLFEERYAYAKQRYDQLVPRGRQWLKDIHWAERIILAATPAMVRKACVTVGLANGAEAVAVFPLDQYYRVNNDGSVNTDAFEDGSGQGNQQFVDAALAQRYQTRGNPIDQQQQGQKVPGWFDDRSGQAKANQGYEQTRLCWNKRDWDHTEQQSNGQAPGPGVYDGQHDVAADPYGPSGHWHVIHTHLIDLLDPITYSVVDVEDWYGISPSNQLAHDYGHGTMDGPDAGQHDPVANSQTELPAGLDQYAQQGLVVLDPAGNANGEHHMAQTCPTCAGQGTVTHKEQGPDGAEAMFNNGQPFSVFDPNDQFRPRPIRMKAAAFRLGVCVATFRTAEGFDATIFPANDFGNLAIACAQIGVRDPRQDGRDVVAVATNIQGTQAQLTNGRTVNLDTTSQEDLYFGDQGAPGLRFGARLVPVARELTWPGTGASSGGAAGQGLQTLINGNDWYTSPTAQSGTSPPAALSNLQNFINPAASAKSFPQ